MAFHRYFQFQMARQYIQTGVVRFNMFSTTVLHSQHSISNWFGRTSEKVKKNVVYTYNL